MSDIHVQRTHQLGLAKARELMSQWIAQAERQFQLSCTLTPGEHSDTVAFSRSGVKGQLVVAADCFDLTASLSFLLKGFSKKIEAEIEKNLDVLLVQGRRDDGHTDSSSVR